MVIQLTYGSHTVVIRLSFSCHTVVIQWSFGGHSLGQAGLVQVTRMQAALMNADLLFHAKFAMTAKF